MSEIKRIIISKLAPAVLLKTGAHKLFAKRFAGIGHILMLHRVLPEKMRSEIISNRYAEVTPEFLDKAIDLYIKSGYQIVSMDEALQRISNKDDGPKFVAFTFDDGYKDNIKYALPVFEKYKCPFTVYPVSGFIDRQVLPWWILAEEALKRVGNIEIKLYNAKISFKWTGTGNKDLFMYDIHQAIISSDEPLFRDNKSLEISNISIDDIFDNHFMTAEELAGFSTHDLVTIGAHSATHRAFNKLSEGDIIDEINSSVERIGEVTGKKVNHFCYPYGSRSEVGNREFTIATKAIIKSAVSTRQAGIFHEHEKFITSLPRYHFTMGLSKYNDFTKLFSSGSVQAVANKFKKVVTN